MAWATAKMFGPFGHPGDQDPRRNVPGAAALDLWLAIPFYLGLAIAVLRLARPVYAILVISLVGLLLPGIFSEYAPHFHRILGAAAPVALLCAVGLDWLWNIGRTRFAGAAFPFSALRWASILLLLFGAVGSARDYFVRWATLPDLFYAFDVGLCSMGQRIAALPPNSPVYLTPRDVSDPTIAFALRTQPGAAPSVVSFDGRHIFPLTAALNEQPEYYAVIEHEDFRAPLLLPELFPTATTVEQINDALGKRYGSLVERPATTTPQRPPQHTLVVKIGDGIQLAGYDVQPETLRPGEILYLQLHWQVKTAPAGDWTVFTHLLGRDASGGRTVVAGHDSPPGEGSLPTPRWQAGWRLLDEYQIPLPADLAPGRYELAIGLYQPTGDHLPADPSGVNLGEVQIE